MTDTRLPEHYLTSPVLDGLTADAFRVFINGLLWSATHGTDGLLPERALRYLHPDGNRPELSAELIAAGLWDHDDDGYHVPDFLKYQTPAAQIEQARALARERKRRQRERESGDDGESSPDLSVSRVTGRVTARVTSEDRTGQAAVKGTTYETFVGAPAEKEQPGEPVVVDPVCYSCRSPIAAGAAVCGWSAPAYTPTVPPDRRMRSSMDDLRARVDAKLDAVALIAAISDGDFQARRVILTWADTPAVCVQLAAVCCRLLGPVTSRQRTEVLDELRGLAVAELDRETAA